jgi:hypothetical protein
MAKKRNIDWDSIKEEFETSEKSINQIAKDHRISDAAIHKKSKAHGWIRYNAEVIEAIAEKKARGIVDVKTSNHAINTMPLVLAERCKGIVRTRLEELESQLGIFQQLGSYINEAIAHTHKMEQQKDIDERFGPEYYGKMKLTADVADKVKTHIVGKDPIYDGLEDIENDEGEEEFIYGIVVPEAEQKRLKEIDEQQRDEKL